MVRISCGVSVVPCLIYHFLYVAPFRQLLGFAICDVVGEKGAIRFKPGRSAVYRPRDSTRETLMELIWEHKVPVPCSYTVLFGCSLNGLQSGKKRSSRLIPDGNFLFEVLPVSALPSFAHRFDPSMNEVRPEESIADAERAAEDPDDTASQRRQSSAASVTEGFDSADADIYSQDTLSEGGAGGVDGDDMIERPMTTPAPMAPTLSVDNVSASMPIHERVASADSVVRVLAKPAGRAPAPPLSPVRGARSVSAVPGATGDEPKQVDSGSDGACCAVRVDVWIAHCNM